VTYAPILGIVRAMATCRFVEDTERPGLAPQIAALEAVLEPNPWGEDSLRGTLELPGTLLAVTEDSDGQILSYCLLQRVLDEASVLQVGTALAFQRQGLARKLIRFCCDRLRALAVTMLWLEVRAHNTAALALYEQLGFVKTGVRTRYYPPIVPGDPEEDALVLCLTLAPA
jgi:ribosomal-protein-alanine N-acetyltransferase